MVLSKGAFDLLENHERVIDVEDDGTVGVFDEGELVLPVHIAEQHGRDFAKMLGHAVGILETVVNENGVVFRVDLTLASPSTVRTEQEMLSKRRLTLYKPATCLASSARRKVWAHSRPERGNSDPGISETPLDGG